MVPLRALYVVGVGLCGLLPLVLLGPVLRNRGKPGATGLLIAVPGVSLWSVGLALNLAAATPLQWYLTATLTLLATNVTVVGWLVTAGEYAEVLAPGRRVLGLLALFPLSIQLAAWTNPLHHLLFPPLGTITLGVPVNIPLTDHPVLLVHTVGSYAIVVVGFGVLLDEARRASGIRRRQALALAASALLPVVPNVLFIAGLTRFQLTPLGFVGTVFVLAWALLRADFLDVVPVGRSRAVESMDDPVVTLDAGGHVVDANPAARKLVGAGPDWEGVDAEAFFEPLPELYERIEGAGGVEGADGVEGEELETEFSFTDEGRTRHFVLNASPIRGPQDEHRGTLVVLHEFTALKNRERDLDLLRQVQSRVLRHNFRNDVTVLVAYGEVFAEELDDEHAEMADRLVSTAEGLVSLTEKARAVEKLVEAEQVPTRLDLEPVLRDLVDQYRERHPEVAFTLDAPEDCVVETVPAIELAFRNLIENAAEHTDAADPTVDVTVTPGATSAVVSVSDNGPGIPDHELGVLEQREETDLQHGSGVGLWVVDWIVQNSATTIEFETGDDGSTVTVRVPRADISRD